MNTASPSGLWATPLPSLDSRSMRRVRSWFFCRGMEGLLYWWSSDAGTAGASVWDAKYLLGGTPLARLNTREK